MTILSPGLPQLLKAASLSGRWMEISQTLEFAAKYLGRPIAPAGFSRAFDQLQNVGGIEMP